MQASKKVLELTKEINAARLAGNRLEMLILAMTSQFNSCKEDGVTGNNLELAQSNLLTQYTEDRLAGALADAQDN